MLFALTACDSLSTSAIQNYTVLFHGQFHKILKEKLDAINRIEAAIRNTTTRLWMVLIILTAAGSLKR